MPQYALLIYHPEGRNPSREEMYAEHQRWQTYTQELVDAGHVQVEPGPEGRGRPPPPSASATASARSPTARSPRRRSYLAGVYLIEAEDLDGAIDVGARMPSAEYGAGRGPPGLGIGRRTRRPRSSARGARSAPPCSPRRSATPATSSSPRTRCQDAFAAAVASWPRDGVPGNPGAWLTVTARRQGDRPAPRASRRRPIASTGSRSSPGCDAQEHDVDTDDGAVEDDRLRLIFTCCHPALALPARVALTLRTLGGLTTARDRARVPRRGAHDGPAARRARSARSPTRTSRTACRRDEALPDRLAGVLAGRLPDLQRGLRRRPRATGSSAASCAARRSGSAGCSRG